MKIRINFLGGLTLLFIALKLTNYISWWWIWVLLPIWILPVAVFVSTISFFIMSVVMYTLIETDEDE